jgi:hypothetical protein
MRLRICWTAGSSGVVGVGSGRAMVMGPPCPARGRALSARGAFLARRMDFAAAPTVRRVRRRDTGLLSTVDAERARARNPSSSIRVLIPLGIEVA